MKILYLNNDGGGYADHVEVPDGTTIEQFLANHLHGVKPGDALIRVNRQPVARDQVLHDGDRVSVSPMKIQGAGVRRHRLNR